MLYVFWNVVFVCLQNDVGECCVYRVCILTICSTVSYVLMLGKFRSAVLIKLITLSVRMSVQFGILGILDVVERFIADAIDVDL